MKLTSKCEYGLLALLYMARQDQRRPVTVAEIAEAQGIPRKFLEQILLALKLAGYLRSSKGPAGGFRLAVSPARVSLAKVIRALDGALAPTESVSKYFYEATPIEREEGLVLVFKDIRDYISDKLERTSLADLCGSSRTTGGKKEQ